METACGWFYPATCSCDPPIWWIGRLSNLQHQIGWPMWLSKAALSLLSASMKEYSLLGMAIIGAVATSSPGRIPLKASLTGMGVSCAWFPLTVWADSTLAFLPRLMESNGIRLTPRLSDFMET